MAHDPIVAGHYADFDLAKTRTVRLAEPRMAYVSYRFGNQIFWTDRKLRLAAGETILTDGVQEARARCGNRLSEIARAPVSPLQPPQRVFDTAPPLLTLGIPAFDPPIIAPIEPLVPPELGEPPLPTFVDTDDGFPPLPPPIIIGGGGCTPPAPPTPPVPPVSTPEPGFATLLIVGGGALTVAFTLTYRANT